MISNATTTVTHNIGTRQMTTILMHAHMTDSTQRNTLHSMEENASSFADDTDTHCDFSITDHTLDTENTNGTHTGLMPKYPTIHS